MYNEFAPTPRIIRTVRRTLKANGTYSYRAAPMPCSSPKNMNPCLEWTKLH